MNNKCSTYSNKYKCHNDVDNLDESKSIKIQHVRQDISFNFIYDTPEELFKISATISKVFDLDYETLEIEPNEKIGSISIPTINKELFDVLYKYYDDNIKVMYIADDILIGSEKSFNEMGL